VTGASVEISTSIEQMAAGAQEQTSQTEEVAKAVGKMAESVVENSKNACQAAEISLKTKDAAEKGGQIVQETVKRMKDIAGIVQKCETVIQKLGDSSDKIGSIVQVIDHITDQTNLLALNAAIEAARAGEHGRGFSVVADEVKKLSEQTSKSTNEIAAMINSIQLGTSDAIQMMGQTSVQVDGGIELAERAGSSLFDIVQIAQQSTDMVHQIASASEEQSATSLQISKSMEAIALVTHQTASGSEQIARTAEDLNKLTESLNNLVGQFKLTSQAKSEETNLQIKRKIENQSLSQYTVKENGSIHNLSKQKTTYHKSTVAQNQLI
jgi:methyl-accepting chemotaxis protein